MYICYVSWRSSKSKDERYRMRAFNDSHFHVSVVEGGRLHRTLCGLDPNAEGRLDVTVAVAVTPRGGFDAAPTEPPIARPVCAACLRSSGRELGRLVVRGLAQANLMEEEESDGTTNEIRGDRRALPG